MNMARCSRRACSRSCRPFSSPSFSSAASSKAPFPAPSKAEQDVRELISMTEIAIQRVSKGYGRTPVLKGVDLDIRDGEFISFLGPSGCGKSTLLFCIAGLEEITEGSILFDGRDVGELSPRDRNVALVFQDYALYPHIRLPDNLAFPLRHQKVAYHLVPTQAPRA